MEYIVMSPHGRPFRVREENLNLVKRVKGWRVQRSRTAAAYYNQKTGKINNKYKGVKELRTEKDVKAVGATYDNEFELLFGRLTELTR